MHAKGPWRYADTAGGHQYALIAESDPSGRDLAYVLNRDASAEDNARLIAAAPDLLAALQEYQRLVAYLQRTTNPEEWATHGDWLKLQREGAAAVSKALDSI